MTELVRFEHVSKRYGAKGALSNISLSLTNGRIIGLIGDNGSGKTTLMKLLAGLLRQDKGTITADGKEEAHLRKHVVSYMPDQPCLDGWMKVKDAVQFYHDFFVDFQEEKVRRMLDDVGISYDEKISALSKGNLEKLQLVLTLCRDVSVYVLDEPLGGIDLVAREHIIDLILDCYDEHRLFLISTHLIQEMETMFDEIIMLKDGNVVLHDSVEELRLRKGQSIAEVFKEVFQ